MSDSETLVSGFGRELIRETVTMALYIGLSLLAVLVAIPKPEEESSTHVALTVALSALGLVVAHQIAFRVSTRLVSRGALPGEDVKLLLGQIAGGLAVVVIATVPLLIWGPDALIAVEVLLVALVAVVGYVAARSVPVSRLRAILYMAGVVLAVAVVLWLKLLVGH